MPGPVTVKNAVDTWTDQVRATKVIPQSTRLALRTGGAGNAYGWIYFTLPFPRKVRIISAYLNLYSPAAIAGSYTVTARRASSKWSVNKIRYGAQPNVTGDANGFLARTGAAANTVWAIPVTTMMQEVADGAAWYGFRITGSTSALTKWHASESTSGAYRPTLTVTWTTAPDEPDDLVPSQGRAVSVQYPLMTYDFSDPNGEADQASQQIQFAATDTALLANTPAWDSGEVPTTAPQFASGATYGTATPTTTWPGIAVDQVVWWRVRVKDLAGNWSVWSDPESFTRKALGVADIVSASITEGSPALTLSYTGGGTPLHMRVMVYKTTAPNDMIWDSGMTPWDTAVQIPFGVIDNKDATYRVQLRVWDSILRVATVGNPAYAEVIEDKAVVFSGGVASVTSIAVASDPILPIGHLTWNHAGAPTHFQILRSVDGGTTWNYIGEVEADDALVSGTSYKWDDTSPPAYQSVQWAVVAVIGGAQSNMVTVTGNIRRLTTFLFRTDGTSVVGFLNVGRSMGFDDTHGIHEPLAGPAVLVTQKLGLRRGSVSGRLVDEIGIAGMTAKSMLASFKSMRKSVGETLFLAYGDETLKVNAYNFNYDVLTDASGVSYIASFDFIEVN